MIFLRVAPIPDLVESHAIPVGKFGSKSLKEMFSLVIDLSLSNWFPRVKV